MSRRPLLLILSLCLAAVPAGAQTRVKTALLPVLPGGLAAGPLPVPLFAAPPIASMLSPTAVHAILPAAPTRLFPPAQATALPKSALVKPSAAAPREAGAKQADEKAGAAGDALFDARRLQPDDKVGLILSGFREDANRLLAPQTGKPVTNAQMRSIQNSMLEARGRGTLLRLAHETSPDGSKERKAALIDLNRDALPREVLQANKAGPERERATILRRLSSLYRRWIERAPPEDEEIVAPANAAAEEKLGTLIAKASVERFSTDPEGRKLLAQLRDGQGHLRLPTMRVLRLANAGALYTSYGRQLVINLDYLKHFLVARLPEAERAEADKSLATEAGALEYLSQSPARAAALAAAIDVTLFHELVHFRQDLERPLMTAFKKDEVTALMTLEHEYEAYFRQDLYIHSLLSAPGAGLDIDRLDDYLRLIDDFESWKSYIESVYSTSFLNGYTAMEELVKLQDGSRRLMTRLAGPDAQRSSAATKRLEAAARGTHAVATEKKAAEDELAEYRRRWPSLARDGLRRWAEINEGLGRWPETAIAQDKLARLAATPEGATAWREKSEQTADMALMRLAMPGVMNLDERIAWINALAARSNDSNIPWKKELWIAFLRDYPTQAGALRVAAGQSTDASKKNELLSQAQTFETAVDSSRATLRGFAETNLASALTENDQERRDSLIEWGTMQAEVLGDAPLIASFKALGKPLSAAGRH